MLHFSFVIFSFEYYNKVYDFIILDFSVTSYSRNFLTIFKFIYIRLYYF
ncbi:hypothetical protein CCYN49044_330006 [Capnocytophaga cynodegmi]|uniref:Uncharacterized protein n=1 Tax=Capnocytophaga cynodegmi TaxID=28189 RepID=A0A0B7HE20_9FLAO|nr:hypothetical protein CCYN74_230015 [Capnocytophaga cynodegmi]CEN39776.1 hypothetical protein CCYN49044_330006 [Capnocytophaga cynodegmi]